MNSRRGSTLSPINNRNISSADPASVRFTFSNVRLAGSRVVSRSSSASRQIKAGTDFISWLDNRFIDDISDPEERVKFILASYNVGPGHIFDAMTLARKYGKDPKKWEDNVNEYLLKKSNPVYYRDPDVKYGYARGIETYNYVKEVLERYEHYKNIIEEASDESS